jgi:valyl-tRNA synthetase
MSKSKGNILDPLDIIDGISIEDLVAKRTTGLMKPKDAPKIEKATRKEFPDGIPAFGADALRFTMAALAGPGRDIKFDLNRAEGYKNFCNKLWNATRFVLMNTEGFTASGPLQPHTPAEHWILRKLENLCEAMPRYFERGTEDEKDIYRFDLAANDLYELTWHWYCDSFLEAAKQALNGDDEVAAKSTQHTLLYVLDHILRLLHPLIPFVTEELWRQVAPRLGNACPTISTQEYPKDNGLGDRNAASDFDWALGAAHQIRALRSQMGIPPSKLVPLIVEGELDDPYQIARHQEALKFLAKLESVTVLKQGETVPVSMLMPLRQLKFHIPLEGLVDLDAERVRLDKELKRVEGELAKSQAKLASETFVQNAPAAVVEQERQRLVDWSAQRDALSKQRARL